MMKRTTTAGAINSLWATLILFSMSGCKTELPVDKHSADDSTRPRAVYSVKNVSFNRADGSYTSALATSDFGNLIDGWSTSRASITDNACRILLVANKTTDCGLINKMDIEDGSEYVVEYKVKFDPNFHFKTMGKLGFGLLIGDGNTGCNPAWSGEGGSLRTMWVNRGADTVLVPYVYYKDQPAECGNSFMARYPATGSINKGEWYIVKLYAKSNTGSNSDGHVKMVVNGTVILDQPIRWTTDDTKRLIQRMSFSTFRGGGAAASPSDGYIYYDYVIWTRLTP